MKASFRSIAAAALSAALCLLAGCQKPDMSVKNIFISSTLNLTVGETATLQVKFDPADAENQSVSWSSSDGSVASVDNSGKVTALKDGTATITVTSADGGKTATCTVSVYDPTVLKGISLNPSTLSIGETESGQLTVIYQPETAKNKKVTWKSSDTGVATVSSSGVVSAVALGSADITATSADGGYTATCKVTVIAADVVYLSSKTGEYAYKNGETYSYPDGLIRSVYSDGTDLYDAFNGFVDNKEGVYKNGKLWVNVALPDEKHLVGVVGSKLFFWDVHSFSVYDSAKKTWVYKDNVTSKPSAFFTNAAIAADGTAYIVGRYEDKTHNNGGMVAAMWTISSDQSTVTETVFKQNSSVYDYNAFSVAVDKSGAVWTLTYRATAYGNGGLKLYKDGKYQRTVYTDVDANDCHSIAFHDNDYYIVTTVSGAKEIRVYKNSSSSPLYKITKSSTYADDAYCSKKGDLYFSSHSYQDQKAYIYKNDALIYTTEGSVSDMAIVH